MRTAWVRLCADTSKSLLSPAASRQFDGMALRHAALATFTSPGEILADLRRRDGDHAHANGILHALLTEYQLGSRRARDLVGKTLFVAMKPALDNVFRRVHPHFGSDDDAVSAVSLGFYEQIAKWSLAKTEYIAGGLQEETQRAVVAERARLFNDRKRVRTVTTYADTISESASEPDADADGANADGVHDDGEYNPHEARKQGSARDFWRSQPGACERYDPDDAEIVRVRRVLDRVLKVSSDESLLLVLKGPCRRSWIEIGEALGLKPETARKRYQMLLRRLRARVIAWADLPGLEEGLRTLGVGDEKTPKPTRRLR